MKHRVAVVGAGIGGLTVAFELLERSERLSLDLDLVCLEAEDRSGGHLRTTRDRGFLYEWAATGFLDNAPATLDLVRRLGLDERKVQARDAAARRYIYARGKLREIPLSPPAFLASGVLTPVGLLRLLCEPLVPQRRSPDEETVYDFASRRIGHQAASVLIDALTTGIFAGDVKRLSLEATYPKMREMESRHGGLFRAMLAKRKAARAAGGAAGGPSGPGGRLTSFREGMQELPDALARALDGRLRLNSRVEHLSHLGRRGIRVVMHEGAPLEFDAVVLACPARVTAAIVEEMDPELAGALAEIRSAPVTVVHLGYLRDALPTREDGFGYLAPRAQGVRTLGTLWPSDIFEGRAPDGSQLMTTMIGGAHDPDASRLNDPDLVALAREDLRTTMQILPAPYFTRVIRNPEGIPQYELGHLARVDVVERRLREIPGLRIAGNALYGVSVNLCVEHAGRIAEETVEFLRARTAS